MMVASTHGVEIAVHDLGGEGPILLLAHATGFHGRVWQPVADRLPDAHCIAPDLRGHGDSIGINGLDYEWDGFADDLLAVVDALDVRPLVAAGHSKGGAALLLAEQRRPGTFAALYCYEPIVVPPMEPTGEVMANPLADSALKRRATFDSFDAAFANFAAKPPLNALDPEALRAYVDFGFSAQPDGSIALKCRPEVEAQVYRMGAKHGAFGRLDQVQCPVTVATGAELPFGPSSFAAAVVAALPHATIERHPDLGHFGPLEDPDAIAVCIRRALLGDR